MENYLFYADTQSGFIIKVISEILNNCLTNEAFFRIQKSGIFLTCMDEKETTLLNLELPSGEFDNFECNKNMTICIGLKQFQKTLKNIKKKDTITLWIEKTRPTKLGIKINSQGGAKKSDRVDTFEISIREDNVKSIIIPEDHNYPKVIPTNDFQKICKNLGIVLGKTLKITIQQNNYIQFYCDGEDVTSVKSEFGEFNPKLPKKQTFEKDFYISSLTQLIKIPGLSQRMQISAPKHHGLPIRIKVHAGTLGTLDVYLKTKEQIDFDDSEASKTKPPVTNKKTKKVINN